MKKTPEVTRGYGNSAPRDYPSIPGLHTTGILGIQTPGTLSGSGATSSDTRIISEDLHLRISAAED